MTSPDELGDFFCEDNPQNLMGQPFRQTLFSRLLVLSLRTSVHTAVRCTVYTELCELCKRNWETHGWFGFVGVENLPESPQVISRALCVDSKCQRSQETTTTNFNRCKATCTNPVQTGRTGTSSPKPVGGQVHAGILHPSGSRSRTSGWGSSRMGTWLKSVLDDGERGGHE